MKVNIIVAMDNNRGIGIQNQLPWSFKEDIEYFKNITKGASNNAVVMGKNTYHSINRRLPCRDNIVLSSSLNQVRDKMFLCKSMDELLAFITTKDYDDVWIIGGTSIYQQFLHMPEYINQVFITHIDNEYECDSFFPHLPVYYNLIKQHKIFVNNTYLHFSVYDNMMIE